MCFAILVLRQIVGSVAGLPFMSDENTFPAENITAAARIYEEHGDFIYSVIRYQVTDESLVDDLFQDFFLALIANPLLKAFLRLLSEGGAQQI